MTVPSEFRRRDDGHFEIDLGAATACFTTRQGGSSVAPYDSLNLGINTGDDLDRVSRNYETLAEVLSISSILVGHQVHGNVVELRSERADKALGVGGKADGQVTTRKEVAVAVQVADCLPIVIAGTTVVAALHGGWRGLSKGIIEAGVSAIRAAGDTKPLSAAVGPGAGVCCYEVGDEVRAAFADCPDECTHGRNVDLHAVAQYKLEAAGVETVHDIGICTICSDPSEFYSYRRDDGKTGRQLGVGWLR